MTATTVSFHGVTKRYRSLAALDGVDLDLGSGITGLLGPQRSRQDDDAPRHGHQCWQRTRVRSACSDGTPVTRRPAPR